MDTEFTERDRVVARSILRIVFVIAAAPVVGFVILGCSLGIAVMYDLMVMAPLWCVFLSWRSSYRWEVEHGVHIRGHVRCTPVERPIRVKPLIEGQLR